MKHTLTYKKDSNGIDQPHCTCGHQAKRDAFTRRHLRKHDPKGWEMHMDRMMAKAATYSAKGV